MRVLFELEVPNDELTRAWQDEVRDVAKHYFKEGVSASVVVDEAPDQTVQWQYDLETDTFEPAL